MEAGISGENVSAIFYTKVRGMVGPLKRCAVQARMLSQMWSSDEKKCAIVAVNHCIGHIAMGRVAAHNSAENDLSIDSKSYENLSMIVELSMKLTFANSNMNLSEECDVSCKNKYLDVAI